MKSSTIKYVFVAFGIGMMACFQAKAQQFPGSYQAKINVENRYSNSFNSEIGPIVFASGIHSLWTIRPSGTPINQYFYLTNPSDHLVPIDGPLTPKGAIFCQFENRLWKSFDIGIRLRVETPPPSH